MAASDWKDEDVERFTEFLQHQEKWADGVMARPNVRYDNGRWSHDVALVVGNVAAGWLISKLYLEHHPDLASEAMDAEVQNRFVMGVPV